MLEDDAAFSSADIYIQPPSNGNDTDEDSGPEDAGGTVENLTGRQLREEAEATVHTTDHQKATFGGIDSDNESDVDEQERISALNQTSIVETTDISRKRLVREIQTKVKRAKEMNPPKITQCKAGVSDNGVDEEENDKTESCLSVPSTSPSIVGTKAVCQKRSARKNQSTIRTWKKKDLKVVDSVAQELNKPSFLQQDMTPCMLFELFFDEQVIDMIVNMTTLYANQKGKPSFKVTSGEIRSFMAVLLVSGYVPLPRRRMYWESSSDVRNEAVSNSMSLNRFEEVMRYLHLADNTKLDGLDKMAKVRPLFELLNERCLRFWPVEKELSIDESMVPYYGRHSSKQFIRGKPIRFGFKVWSLNTRLGYLIRFEPYQGASSIYDPNLGLGGSVVMHLLSEMPRDVNLSVYMDNFFTTLNLFDRLQEKGITATGTIRSNRIQNCPVLDADKMKKKPRGEYDFRTDATSGIIVVRWHDNSIVNMASNNTGVQPLMQVKRWSSSLKKHISITQPAVIGHYNRCMGGTDRMDQNINLYRVSIRSKKWWWSLFAFTVDAAVCNAWYLYRCGPASKQHPLPLIEFRRQIALTYFAKYSSRVQMGRPISAGRHRPLASRLSSDVRYDGYNHHLEAIATQRRCVICGLKTKRVCSKCSVSLHDRCFGAFHSKQ